MGNKSNGGHRSIDDFVEAQRRRKGMNESRPRSSRNRDYSEDPDIFANSSAANKSIDKKESFNEYRAGAKAPKGDKTEKNNKGSRQKHKVGLVLSIIQLVLSVLIMILLFILNIIPNRYLLIAGGVLAALWVIAFLMHFAKNRVHIVGKIISIVIIAALVAGAYYITVTNNMISAISGYKGETSQIAVAVLKEDPAENIDDVLEYKIGIQKNFTRKAVNTVIDEIQTDSAKTLNIVEYDSTHSMAKALVSKEVGAIIYNTALDSTLNDMYGSENFTNAIRIITKKSVQEDVVPDAVGNDIADGVFALYISGNDTYEMDAKGRSDVNILAVVNSHTKQILLVNTPRDYYLIFAGGVTEGTKDKLTHAGWYGVECSKDTLSELYDINVDYFVKVNFEAVVKMVDLLGGVDVYSEEEFTCNAGIHFNEGINHMDGKTCLEFVRERKHLSTGDNQRGRNQMAVIKAMLDKVLSPAIISSYASIMESMSDCMITNMPEGDIKAFVKMQLDENASWNVVKLNATGFNSDDYCYTLGATNYVMEPDHVSVDFIKGYIQKVVEGQEITEPDTSEGITDTGYVPKDEGGNPIKYVTVEGEVNIREAPDANSEWLGVFKPGEKAEYIRKEGDWIKIKYNDAEVYIFSEYAKIN